MIRDERLYVVSAFLFLNQDDSLLSKRLFDSLSERYHCYA